MRPFFLIMLFVLWAPHTAVAFGSIACGIAPSTLSDCTWEVNSGSEETAEQDALTNCRNAQLQKCQNVGGTFYNICKAVAQPFDPSGGQIANGIGKSAEEARANALLHCQNGFHARCDLILTACDATPSPVTIAQNSPSPPEIKTQIVRQIVYLSNDTFSAALSGFFLALLVALALIFRSPLANFIIHGNLPPKLPVYGKDIQVLFKRTQRVNWYGRTVFGIVVNLAMTHQQLIDVRKYWLGRVIAFDSLRRQRQNQLATMHLQLAAQAKSEAHDKRKFWSRRWATIRSLFKKLLWVFIAIFNAIMALFFIRVIIARLIRGTVIESTNLVLILQAKDAIEQTTQYLKEYLLTANTFDDRDEVYEPE